STRPCGPTNITAWIFVRFFRSLSAMLRNFVSAELRVRRSPVSALLWLTWCILITWSKHADRIQRLHPWGDEEQQLRGALYRVCVLKQLSDNRQVAQTRALSNIKSVLIDQDSTDHGGPTIRYQHLRCRRLRSNRRNSIDRTRKIRLLVGDVYLQQNRACLGDLRCNAQIESEPLELRRNRVVDVRLNRYLRGLFNRRGNIVLSHHFWP